MSHLTQMLGLTVQNFVSAAAGMAVVVGLIRGITRTGTRNLGNFWVDLTRTIVRILLPLALVFTVVLISQGVVQNLHGDTIGDHRSTQSTEVTDAARSRAGRSPRRRRSSSSARNGGGPYNANSAHPFENPTGFTDMLESVHHPADPVRVGRDVRQDGRRQAPGRVLIVGDGRDPGRCSPASRCSPSRTATRC